MTNFEKVKTFMKTFGQEVKEKSSFSSDKINELRYSLIKEELEDYELVDMENIHKNCLRNNICFFWWSNYMFRSLTS